MYCEFEPTGEVFKNKKIYKCSNCDLTLALEDPDAKITCFSYSQTVFNQELDGKGVTGKPVNIKTQAEIDALAQQVIAKHNDLDAYAPPPDEAPAEETLCTDEQISDRLAICNRCEYYENDACTLCGCHIVREKNYMNKLAKKESMCPDGRWGPVND
jgi:hypothetical protein|tara:strand:+ start:1799 stop:2269 length:471 start_codon:yes stop_codon:yes gene_type:complete